MTIYTIRQEDGSEKRYVAQNGKLVEVREKENENGKRALSLDEARALLGLSRNSFVALINSGQIKARKAGRKWLISPASLDAFMEGSISN